MKKTNLIYTAVALLGLTSCNQTEPFVIKTIAPTGAPTIAFFDKGLDTTNYVTSTGPTVLAELQRGEYEAIITDSSTALGKLKDYSTDYKFAKLITGGNLFLTSINKEPGAMPQPGDVVVGFQKMGVPGKVFQKLLDTYWNIETTVEWAKDAPAAKAVLETGLFNGEEVDFVLMAQPALQVVLSNNQTTRNIQVVKNLKEEWKTYTGQDAIPQAGLFVKKSSYDAHKQEFKEYINHINENLELALTNPAAVKASMDEQISNPQQQGARFGFPAGIMLQVQKDGKNGLGVIDPDTTYGRTEFNNFLSVLGEATIGEQYFLN